MLSLHCARNLSPRHYTLCHLDETQQQYTATNYERYCIFQMSDEYKLKFCRLEKYHFNYLLKTKKEIDRKINLYSLQHREFAKALSRLQFQADNIPDDRLDNAQLFMLLERKRFFQAKMEEFDFTIRCFENDVHTVMKEICALLYYPIIKCMYRLLNPIATGRVPTIRQMLVKIYHFSYVEIPLDHWNWDTDNMNFHPLIDCIERVTLQYSNGVNITSRVIAGIVSMRDKQILQYLQICSQKASKENTIDGAQKSFYENEYLLRYLFSFLACPRVVDNFFEAVERYIFSSKRYWFN